MFGQVCLASSLSALGILELGSSCFMRSFLRPSLAVSIFNRLRSGFMLSALDASHFGSPLLLKSFARLGLAALALDLAGLNLMPFSQEFT